MSHRSKNTVIQLAPVILSLAGMGFSTPSQAAEAGKTPTGQSVPTATSSTSAKSSASEGSSSQAALLKLLVRRGILTEDEARELNKQAEADAAASSATAAKGVNPDGSVTVSYVPEIVKKQMREDIEKEVLAQAKAENWAAPNSAPEWSQRIKFKGDFRTRAERVGFSDSNVVGQNVNFNAINTSSTPVLEGTDPNPALNVDANRSRLRLRARLAMDADLGEDFSTTMRLSTGENNSPVSGNQSLGYASGQGGNFSKYGLWLDRAALTYKPEKDIAVSLGRFDNPFFSTELLWADDLGFDGAAVKGSIEATKEIKPFFAMGAFPVFNTDLNFSTYQAAKSTSTDKWLMGLQGGTDWSLDKETAFKIGAAYYHYSNVEGKLSSPCNTLTSKDSCDTDARRPSFAQKGNTYMRLRNIPTGNQYQYYGLATPFRELALTGRLDYDGFNPIHVALDAEGVKNLAFNKNKVRDLAVNNCGPGTGLTCDFNGGDMGYLLRMTVGSSKLAKRWDWNASLAYKYVESDAVVDGLTDSDFGLGGTNLKGFILGGNLALSKNVQTSVKWMSADNIGGPTFGVDTFQLDMSAKF